MVEPPYLKMKVPVKFATAFRGNKNVYYHNAWSSAWTHMGAWNVDGPLAPNVHIDLPAANATVQDTVYIAGWAIDNAVKAETAISRVEIFVDYDPQFPSRSKAGEAILGTARPDVCGVWQGRAGCPNVGWGYQWDSTTVSPGAHTIKARAWDSSTPAQYSDMDRVVTVRARRPTVTFDAPASGATVSGSAVPIAGWAIDNESIADSAISSVQLYVDGVFVGNAPYGVPRADVCSYYPGRAGCPNVGFQAVWDSRTVSNGAHTITVKATDSDQPAARASSVSRSVIVANVVPITGTIAGPTAFQILPGSTSPISMYITNVQNAQAVLAPTWSEANGQDDIIWYQAVNLGNGTWKVTVNPGSHPGTGNVAVRIYGYTEWPMVNPPQFIGGMDFARTDAGWPAANPAVNPTVTSTRVDGLSVTATSGTVDVYALGVLNATSVVFPVWSIVNGQDDLVWYTAANLGNGTWRASVNLAAHPGLGLINIPCYAYGGPGNQAFHVGFASITRN